MDTRLAGWNPMSYAEDYFQKHLRILCSSGTFRSQNLAEFLCAAGPRTWLMRKDSTTYDSRRSKKPVVCNVDQNQERQVVDFTLVSQLDKTPEKKVQDAQTFEASLRQEKMSTQTRSTTALSASTRSRRSTTRMSFTSGTRQKPLQDSRSSDTQKDSCESAVQKAQECLSWELSEQMHVREHSLRDDWESVRSRNDNSPQTRNLYFSERAETSMRTKDIIESVVPVLQQRMLHRDNVLCLWREATTFVRRARVTTSSFTSSRLRAYPGPDAVRDKTSKCSRDYLRSRSRTTTTREVPRTLRKDCDEV